MAASESPVQALTRVPIQNPLCQLIKAHSANVQVMDSVSFAMTHHGTGQCTTTVRALIDITMCLITKSSGIVVVLDNIDECDDSSFLLQHLNLFLQSPECGAISLGRLAVDSSRDIDVHPSNEDTIRMYFFPRAEELQDEDELDTSITPPYSQYRHRGQIRYFFGLCS
jgi:hypothetical protein